VTASSRNRHRDGLEESSSNRSTPGWSRSSGPCIVAIVEELGDMVTALLDTEPEHGLDVCRNLGLRLTYDPET
jgi:hypothetical protein